MQSTEFVVAIPDRRNFSQSDIARITLRRWSWIAALAAACTVPSLAQSSPSPVKEIYTVVGTGVAGYNGDGRAATLAQIKTPESVAFDSQGNYYLADTGNQVIRKVDIQTHEISTFAGGGGCGTVSSPTYCGDNGPATDAQLFKPVGIAFNKAGNLYIADSGNHVVREVNLQTNVITTVAGNGTAGDSGNGGPAIKAELSDPVSVAFDSTGNLYIADVTSAVVREVSASTQQISTFAGGGTGCPQQSDTLGDGCSAALAKISTPNWIAFDPQGNLYIADTQDSGTIRVVNIHGVIETYAGGSNASCGQATDIYGDGCPADVVTFGPIEAIAVDASSNVYVARAGYCGTCGSLIQRIDSVTTIVTAYAGQANASTFAGDGGPATEAAINLPYGMAFDSVNNLYFADTNNNRIREVGPFTATPTFSPLAGTFTGSQMIVLSDATPGAIIYYTLDGSTPTTSSQQYGGAIAVTETTTINAMAKAAEYNDSPVATALYTIILPAATPAFLPVQETYNGPISVTITDQTPEATIYYTTNGTMPTTASTKYTAAIPVSTTETIEAIAVATGYSNSAVASASYTFKVATPVFSPAVGTFTSPISVTVSDATPGVTIYYTTNGTTPTATSTKYTGSIAVSSTETIEAIAIATGYTNSAVAFATYTFEPPNGQLQFVPVTPCRIVDTRNPTGAFGGPELAGNATRTFDVPQSACGIPATAVAYSLNVTVVPVTSLGYLTIFPTGEAQPVVSTLNSDGRVKANATITAAGTNGGVSVFVSDATQFILDIDGYFVRAGTDASGLQFFPLTPCRVADTRGATGGLGAPSMASATSRAFPVQLSSCKIPPTAKAYSLNVTAVPHTSLGFLTAWPTGENQPVVSTLNASTGAVTANAAIVPAGTSGDVSIYVSDASDVILDINGYFAPPATGGLSLYTVAPCRALDTRAGAGAFEGTLTVPIHASTCAPPATAQAYVLNATVVPTASLSFLSLWAAGEAQPVVSTLNASDGAVTSNMAIVPTTNGSIDAFASDSTNLILDISSYFAP
jgi:hypothetical protein